jgi:hypothetical protein
VVRCLLFDILLFGVCLMLFGAVWRLFVSSLFLCDLTCCLLLLNSGGEIVSVSTSFIAHMWRDGSAKTQSHYKRIGDSTRNRWRAVKGNMGEFSKVTLQYPDFARFRPRRFRKKSIKEDLSFYKKVKEKLQCRPFSWYLDRFDNIYHLSGVLPAYTFSIESVEYAGYCLTANGFPLGHAKVANGQIGMAKCSGGLAASTSNMQVWHHANREHVDIQEGNEDEHFHSLRLYQSDQTLRFRPNARTEKFDTSVAIIDGSDVS